MNTSASRIGSALRVPVATTQQLEATEGPLKVLDEDAESEVADVSQQQQ